MTEKSNHFADFKKMLMFKLNLMGFNILSDNFKASKRTIFIVSSHVGALISIAAFLFEKLDDMPSHQLTELIAIFVSYCRLITYLISMTVMNSEWKSLFERIDCERKSLDDVKEAKQLSLIYSKKDFICECYSNILAAMSFVIAVFGNAVFKTNEYRLPFNFYITFLPIDGSSVNWALNFLFQSVLTYSGALVFYSFCSLVRVVLNHACWGIDMVKLLIENLNSILDDDEQQSEVSQKEAIANQIKLICEMHVQVLKWNEDVRNMTQLNFLFELYTTSVLICLTVFTISKEPFKSTTIIVLFIVLICQLFLFCWLGHRVLVKIDELSAAIYGIKWYSLGISHSKSIQMMLRASQNMQGFHGIFKPLSMETFQQVMEFAYSLFTLLESFN